MRGITMTVAASLLALGARASEEGPLRAEIDVTGIGQSVSKADPSVAPPGGEESAVTASGRLRLSADFGRGLSASLAVEGWEGDGFRNGTDLNTLPPVSPEVASVNGDRALETNAAITEAYATAAPEGTGFRVSLGKVDTTMLFCVSKIAGDPRSDFTNYAFRSSAAVPYPGGDRAPYTPAAWMTYKARTRPLEFSAGWAAMVHDDLDGDPYLFAELRLRRRLSTLGVFAWRRGGTYDFVDLSGQKDDPTGFGAYVDWELRGDLQVFAKLAFADEDVDRIASSWSAGIKVAGTPWNRTADAFGIAYSQSITSDIAPGLDANEGVAEVFYKFTIVSPDRVTRRPGLEITPHYQCITNAGGVESDSKTEIVGLRLRAMIRF